MTNGRPTREYPQDPDDPGGRALARRGEGPYYPDELQPLRAPWDPEGESRRPERPEGEGRAGGGRWREFTRQWGWRAYAIPILAVFTVVVLVDTFAGSAGRNGAPPVAHAGDPGDPDSSSVVVGAPSGEGALRLAASGNGRLPEGGVYTERGAREWHVVPGRQPKVGSGTERALTYTVEVENGVDTASYGGDRAFADVVDATLANPLSWTHDPRFSFERIEAGNPDFRVSLTSTATIREVCGYDIQLESSCYNPNLNRVFINDARWVRGAMTFSGDIGSYRQYVINHEVGHAIGYSRHMPCPASGKLAPIMMQQTFGLQNREIYGLDTQSAEVPNNQNTCRFNPWPYPGA